MFKSLGIAAMICFAAMSGTPAAARGGGHGGGHGGGRSGHFAVRSSSFIAAPFFAPYFYAPYYFPPYYADPAYAGSVYIEQGGAPPQGKIAPEVAWYFCNDAKAYYPYVTTCPSPWQRVSPTPPSPGE